MKKELYDEYVKAWDIWKKRTDEYFQKRVEIIKDKTLSEESQSKLLDTLAENFDRKGFTEEYFGPWTEIRDVTDLLNPDFILPGIGKNYSELQIAKDDVPGNWGKIARDCYDPKRYGKIIGLGYDSGDYYLIIKNPDTGEESTILMNTKYTIDS
jgi:hypothetical protein